MSNELWACVENESLSAEDRRYELYDLAQQEDPRLPRFLIDQLSRSDINPDWLNVLLWVAEWTQVKDPQDRTDMLQVAQHHAKLLFEQQALITTPQYPALWSALRRSSTLMELDQLPNFLHFLPDTATTTSESTQLVVYNYIINILTQEPPPPGAGIVALQERVLVYATKTLLDEDRADLLPQKQVRCKSVCSALLLQGVGHAALFQLFLKWKKPGMARMLHTDLARAHKNWLARGDARLEPIVQSLERAIMGA